MKRGWLILVITVLVSLASKAQFHDLNYQELYGYYLHINTYQKNDLGLTYTPEKSIFKVWAPYARRAQLLLYNEDKPGVKPDTIPMAHTLDGELKAEVNGDLKGKFYTYRINWQDIWMDEVTDPYAKATGVNGKKAQVIDLKETDPPGWSTDKSPAFKNATDAIIYELHVRDASIAVNSGIKNKGKFLGLTETGTKNEQGLSTGLDHLKELGVTHIHLLPCFDFNSVDESNPGKAQYNWGYDPLNYNVPEGSYSTNPYDGAVRIKEFKQLVKALHDNGLRVVMDVVYNHTALSEKSNFNQLFPGGVYGTEAGYYYRQNNDRTFANATACGNETASERPMMRKFILESMKYWVQEYHIDGFRVDLMGVHDIATMNIISKELHAIKPDLLLYGEGWTAGSSPLPDSLRALKKYAYKLDRIAVFSDDIRDGIKGSVFEHGDKGFASNKPGMEESIKFGIVASCKHPQVNYSKVNYSKEPYATQPYHTVTYAECHDNHVLWDKLAVSAKDATEAERINMHKLALSIVLTSQGISFLHAGTEFLRSKKGVENSFESADSINLMDWSLKTKNKKVFDYVKALIKMRKEHPAFRMKTAKDIVTHLRFMENTPAGTIAYTINGSAIGDNWKKVFVCFNGTAREKTITPTGKGWQAFIMHNEVVKPSAITSLALKPYSCTILYIQ